MRINWLANDLTSEQLHVQPIIFGVVMTPVIRAFWTVVTKMLVADVAPAVAVGAKLWIAVIDTVRDRVLAVLQQRIASLCGCLQEFASSLQLLKVLFLLRSPRDYERLLLLFSSTHIILPRFPLLHEKLQRSCRVHIDCYAA